MRLAKLESDHGRLLVTFQYRSLRRREYVGLKDTRENRRAAAGIVREIELEIASGKFDYRARFPTSRNLVRLGLQSTFVPEQTVFRDFALRWLEELRPTVARSTAYGYGRLLVAYILPSSFATKNIDAVHDGDIKRLIAELQTKGLGSRSINIVIARLRTIFSTAKIRKSFRTRSSSRHFRSGPRAPAIRSTLLPATVLWEEPRTPTRICCR